MKNKEFNIFNKINTVTKLGLINVFIVLIIAFIMYFVLPYALNYPSNTTDNQFQVDMVGITYSMQYFILVLILVVFLFITFVTSYRKISTSKLKNAKNQISYVEDLRKKCFSYPYFTLIIQTLLPTIVCGALLILFNTNFELLLRICIMILSASAIYAITSYMIGRKFFENTLIATSHLTKKQLSGVRLPIYKKLILQTFPLFLYSSVLIILISISVMTSEKGDLLYHFYRQELLKSFSEDTIYNLEDAKNILNTISLNSDEDHVIMFNALTGDVYYSNGEVNEFLINYTKNYYSEMKGQVFEYYGKNSQASVLRILTDQGVFYVGVRFFVFNSIMLLPFLIVAIFTVLFNVFYIYYIGKALSNDIDNIVEGLKGISNLDNILLANNLPIISNDEIGSLTLQFNKIQDLTKLHIEQLNDNQNKLMEKERLASLGQLIGGIAHNLKTPIMSIAGAAEGLNDLIKEYDASIGDPEVNIQDHHDIAHDMKIWVDKVKNYTEYMSDVITAVKGQAVVLSDEDAVSFSIDELVKRVDILMKHELKNALTNLSIAVNTDSNIELKGNVNSLVQVINNMISNAIQAYNGSSDKNIDFIISKNNSNIIFTIKDYAGGLPKEVSQKLFKEMITTKGKNGTGLGLFMSYSNIRAHFNGNITFKTEDGVGTEFNIIIPL